MHLWVRLRQELQDVGKADDGLLTLKYLLMKSDWHLKHMLLICMNIRRNMSDQ